MDYAKLGGAPVSDKKPSGVDVRFEPIFDELKGELDKLVSPALRDQFDWEKVIEPASVILKSHSKDLLVAAYLGVALMHTDGVKGFVSSAGLMGEVLKNHWETLYPVKKRMRGRISAIQWWVEQTSQVLEESKLPNLQKEEADTILEHLSEIEEFLDSKEAQLKVDDLGETFPIYLLKPIIKGLIIESALPREKGNQQAKITAVSQAPMQDLNNDNSQTSSINSPSDSKKNIFKLFQDIRQQVKHVRNAKPEDPRPYIWSRLTIWHTVDQLPPAIDGKTKIPGPPEHALNNLKNFRDSEDWRELLENAEAKLTNPQYLFCLDISRYSAEALKNMGDAYDGAFEAVCRETRCFVERFPALLKYSYANGAPFAGEETILWLNELKQECESGASDSNTISLSDSQIHEEVIKAQEQSKKKKGLDKAILQLHRSILESGSGKSAFVKRLGLIKILMDNRKASMAIPHIDFLLNEIDSHNLERWEPKVAVEVLRIAIKLYGALKEDEKKKKVPMFKDRIILLDTHEALGMF